MQNLNQYEAAPDCAYESKSEMNQKFVILNKNFPMNLNNAFNLQAHNF
jgi:hypothetical protein